ncbi:DUF4040 domain-containing protein [Candidatus Bipolaricaulota bacterium]|nr:DUF4040 domain-containing protein [Candidatus Bipolaricaulota bacterium]
MGTILFSALTLALAVFALTRRRLLWGVIGVGVHSLALAGLYLFLAAPDVALTQAAVGFGLVTFIYLLAVRRTGKLTVAAVETPCLIYQENERVAGLEWEILSRFGRQLHRDVEVVWASRAEVPALLQAGEVDIGAGAVFPREGEALLLSRPILPTRIVTGRWGPGPVGAVAGDRGQDFLPPGGTLYEDHAALAHALRRGEVEGAVVDLLHVRQWVLSGEIRPRETTDVEEAAFRLAVAPTEADVLRALDAFLTELEETGELAQLVERYVG